MDTTSWTAAAQAAVGQPPPHATAGASTASQQSARPTPYHGHNGTTTSHNGPYHRQRKRRATRLLQSSVAKKTTVTTTPHVNDIVTDPTPRAREEPTNDADTTFNREQDAENGEKGDKSDNEEVTGQDATLSTDHPAPGRATASLPFSLAATVHSSSNSSNSSNSDKRGSLLARLSEHHVPQRAHVQHAAHEHDPVTPTRDPPQQPPQPMMQAPRPIMASSVSSAMLSRSMAAQPPSYAVQHHQHRRRQRRSCSAAVAAGAVDHARRWHPPQACARDVSPTHASTHELPSVDSQYNGTTSSCHGVQTPSVSLSSNQSASRRHQDPATMAIVEHRTSGGSIEVGVAAFYTSHPEVRTLQFHDRHIYAYLKSTIASIDPTELLVPMSSVGTRLWHVLERLGMPSIRGIPRQYFDAGAGTWNHSRRILI